MKIYSINYCTNGMTLLKIKMCYLPISMNAGVSSTSCKYIGALTTKSINSIFSRLLYRWRNILFLPPSKPSAIILNNNFITLHIDYSKTSPEVILLPRRKSAKSSGLRPGLCNFRSCNTP